MSAAIRPLATGASIQDVVRAFNLLVAVLGASGFSLPGLTLTAPLLLADGADAAHPDLAWADDPDNGLYRIGANDIGWSSGGTFNTEWRKSGAVVQFMVADGTVSLPGEAFAADPDTGQRRIGANKAALVAGAVDALCWLLDANGIEVGIGTITPTVALQVTKSQGDYLAILQNTNPIAGGKGLHIVDSGSNAADPALLVTTNSVDRFAVFNDGAIKAKGGEPLQKTPISAACSSNLTLTGTFQDIPGCSALLTPGSWVVEGSFWIATGSAGDVAQAALGRLQVSGGTASVVNQGSLAIAYLHDATQAYATTKSWVVNVTTPTTVTLQASKSGGTGSSSAQTPHTTMTAWYQGNL